MATPTLQILLSTYDGAGFLPAQLDSLLTQTLRPTCIRVRDDGSRDDTLPILHRYRARTGGLLDLTAGSNLGATASFWALLHAADPDTDYTAFCDQDDVWLPDKLARAVAALRARGDDGPLLYCSRLTVTDRDLRPRGLSPLVRRPPVLANALVENIATGCTIVLNRSALALLRQSIPRHAVQHDWWCYLVVAAFGNVVYDPEPGILYRQHGANQVGMASGLEMWTRRYHQFRANRGKGRLPAQAREFLALYGDRLAPAERARVQRFLAGRETVLRRLGLALHPGVYRQRPIDDLILRGMLAAGLH